ncbi:MAG TPA: tetratricopeptide repeat protein [Cyclobacteriaceae bacterium]|nr:tetratricopeptide repeat protein [Cyclobacteriaceae bacterium]
MAETTRRLYTKAVIILITAVAIAFPSASQNLDAVKKLRTQLATAADPQKFDILSSIGFEFRYSYPDSTIIYCNRAFELGEKIKLGAGLSKPLSFIGLAYANKGDYKNSFEFHRAAIDMAAEQKDSTQLAHGYNNLGRMFYDQGDLVRAFDNLIRSKELFEELGDKSGQAYVNRSIASVYSTQHDFEKALEMSRTAFNLRKEVGEPRMIVSSLMELGLIYQAAGNSEDALKFFLKADSASTGINDPVTRAELSIGLAEVLLEKGDLEEAFDRTEHVLGTITEQTNQKMFLRATFLQAKYYHEKKDYARAIALLRKTLESAESSGNVLFQRDASYLLAEIYDTRKDKPRAEEYVNRYKIFSGMLENTDLARQIERLQFQIEIEKKDRDYEILKVQEAKNIATIAKQRAYNITLIVVAASVTSIAAILWINSRRRRIVNHKLALQNSHIVSQREAISRHNEDLSRSNQILSDLNQEKNTLMSIVAHDLKAPLNRISGLASIIEKEDNLSGKQKDYVKHIRNATRSGLDLITDLLDVNALEEVRDAPDKKEVDISQLLDERVKLMQVNANTKAIKIDLKVDANQLVTTDPSYISRIVDNLLSNAIKFSANDSDVKVTASTRNGKLTLSIKDNGPGFHDDDRPFLFQKFKKLSARPTGGESSNGLGLAIVKTLVDRLKGDIHLETARGRGSEFIITLPL